ncbi:MAG: YkgJ family cysteine cluster protein, partial [Elainellaceae cyanobacterium]
GRARPAPPLTNHLGSLYSHYSQIVLKQRLWFMDLDIAHRVMESYAQIDREIEQFQAATQLSCPPGCGQCCENPNVEVTPLEMLPLVLELMRRGDVDDWFDQAQAVDQRGTCVFYAADPLIAENGRCQVYEWRPALCRLFGFSTAPDKTGQPRLAACIRHKQLTPDIVAEAQVAIANGTAHAPSLTEATQQILALDPGFGSQIMPINQALSVAIERVGFWLQMRQDETVTAPSMDDSP